MYSFDGYCHFIRANSYKCLQRRPTLENNLPAESIELQFGVAENLGVGVATVHRIETLFDETGSVGKRKYPDGHGTHKLTENDKVLILGLLVERPETYLHEIQRELQALNGTDVDISTIWRCINHNGFTHKKLKTVALQWNEMLREEYRQEVSVLHKEMFVFVDKTGTDRRDAV